MELQRRLHIARLRLRSLVGRGRVEAELDKELRFHLDQQIAENVALGMTEEEARLAALRQFGGITQIQEECRDMRGTQYIENLVHDLRYTVRTLGRTPGFALVIVLTLALSIGANSAIFSVIDGVLLRPLPYTQADRLVRIFYHSAAYPKFPLNPFDFRDFRDGNRALESMAAMTRSDVQLSGYGEPVRLAGFGITAGFFHVLGLRPARGREFTAADERPGDGRIVILSDRLWRSQFGAAPDILGRKIMLDSEPYTIVGVMPPGVEHPGNRYNPVSYGETVDIWTPFPFQGNPNNRGSHYIEGIGRMKDGVALGQAQADLDAIRAELGRAHPADTGWNVLLVPLYREIVGSTQRMLLVLLGAVGMVLLIACANAANLLLARATARQREIAVRSALGAGRWRLVRQMLAESLFIALLGGGFGAALAAGGVRVLVSLLPAGFPRASAIHLNATVFAFTLLISLGTGLLFGIAPALQASRADLQQDLREGGRGSAGGRRQLRLRNVLVVAEVSLAFLLLAGAGLMLRSFVNLLGADPGFRPHHVLTASVCLPYDQYKTVKAISHFYDQLVTDLNSRPGIQAAGVGTDLPWTGYDDNIGGFNIEGKKPPLDEERHARYHVASPDYFRAAGIPLVRGRFFTQADNRDAPFALIINESMARKYWPNEDAVGRRVAFTDTPKEKDWMRVVGVVGDVKDRADSSAAEPALWWAVLQEPWQFTTMAVVIRSDSEPATLASQLRTAVHRLDPNVAVADVRLMDRIADDSYSTPRFALFLVGLFAGLALTLAAIGMYGVISYSVNQRMHEFGMRMALGARSWDVVRLILVQGLRLAVLGIAVGAVSALALARILGSLLYEVKGTDPLTFLAVSLVAIAAATLACYLPAHKATNADPMLALRAE